MSGKKGCKYEEEEMMELRRGPWTLEEDTLLIHYIACHGEGRWNLLAKCSGLKRTGKSCRLRWLNYLKPDVKRGNLTAEEQILILQLHSKWGNRWSRIAQHLPGRTDNEIKNYWRTRVQKQMRRLKIGADSVLFRDAIQCRFWNQSLIQSLDLAAASNHPTGAPPASASSPLQELLLHPASTPSEVGNFSGIYELSQLENSGITISPEYSMVINQAPATSEFPPATPYSLGNDNIYDPSINADQSGYIYDLEGLDFQTMPATGSVGSSGGSGYSGMEGNYAGSMDELWQVRKLLHEWEL